MSFEMYANFSLKILRFNSYHHHNNSYPNSRINNLLFKIILFDLQMVLIRQSF